MFFIIVILLGVVEDDGRVKEGVVDADALLDVDGLDAAQGGKVVEDARHRDVRSIWKRDSSKLASVSQLSLKQLPF